MEGSRPASLVVLLAREPLERLLEGLLVFCHCFALAHWRDCGIGTASRLLVDCIEAWGDNIHL